MFISIDGLPGAGKSYYLVDYIYNNKDKYYKVFTNINEFKYKDNLHRLEFSIASNYEDTFTYHLEKLKDIYDAPNTTDKELTEYLLENDFIALGEDGKYKPFLLGIDEAHNEFGKKNDLLLWFISYHRHLHVDCILVTQDYSMFASCYYKLVEYYLNAVPSSRVVLGNKRFKYRKYIAVPYNNEKTKTDEIFLTKKKEVFELYHSGDIVRSPNVLKKFGLYILLGLVVAYIMVQLVINYMFPPTVESDNIHSPTVQNVTGEVEALVKKKEKISTISNLKLIELSCTVKRCTNKLNNISFNFDLLQLLIDESSSKIIYIDRKYKSLSVITILASSEFLNYFPKGVSYEKKSTNTIKLF